MSIFNSKNQQHPEFLRSDLQSRRSSRLSEDISHHKGAPLKVAARQLAQVNRQYLALKSVDGGLPEDLALRKDALSDTALTDLADCQFSLFTLGFDDGRCWLEMLNGLDQESTGRAIDLSRGSERKDFATTVVFFAWHLAASDPLAARVLLELDTSVANGLRSVPIAQLHRVAVNASHLLAPRWEQNRFFWSTLLDNVPETEHAAKRTTKMLGRQLLAVQSLGSAIVAVAAEGQGSTRRTRHRKRGAGSLAVDLRCNSDAIS